MRAPIGQPVRSAVEVRDLSGQLVTPDTNVFDMLTPVGLPAVVGPAPTLDSLGKYHVDLTDEIELPGHYVLRWTTTGAGAGVKTDTLDVYDPFGAELLSVADAKKYAQIVDTDTVHDEEIGQFIRALTPTIEFFVGPVEPRTMVRSVRGSGNVLVLPVAPVLEVISLAAGSVTADLTGLVLDSETGIARLAAGSFFPLNGVATFIAGRRDVPANVNHAAKVVFGHLWETQRGRGSTTFSSRQNSGDTTFVPGLGYSVPNRAIEMLKPSSTRTGLS